MTSDDGVGEVHSGGGEREGSRGPDATRGGVSGPLLTADQVAELLGVPKTWIYAQSRLWEQTKGARGIPTVTLGRYRRYRREAIAHWLAELERAA